MEKPDKPAPNECCGGGSCCPCVWDDYFDKLQQWQEHQAEQTKDQTHAVNNTLNPITDDKKRS